MYPKGPLLSLNNGVSMPAVGFGVYQSGPDETVSAVKAAIDAGYGLIDTASGYFNEAEVGRAVRESAQDRERVFVATKVKPDCYGLDATRSAFDLSMSKLGFDVLDLFLLHWPAPRHFDRTVEAWQACRQLLADGRVRAIGVCNFTPAHLDMLVDRTGVVPAVNQIELHPFFVQIDHDRAHRRLGVITQAWSPIGGIQRYWGDGSAQRDPLSNPVVLGLAEKYGKTPAQIVLRWHLELGHAVIPKSVRPTRIIENISLFDFDLSIDEVEEISSLDTGQRGGPDPEKLYNDVD